MVKKNFQREFFQSEREHDSKTEIVHLIQRGKSMRLQAPEGTFSYYHPNNLFTGFGWDAQTASLLLLKHPIRSILILGLGGGTIARQCRALFPYIKIVGVEIDQRIIEIAYEHFNLNSLNVEVNIMPGQTYLRQTRCTFDAIIDDMWLPEPYSPKPVLTESDWALLVRSRLKALGIYGVNLYNRQENRIEVTTAIKRLKATFPLLREIRPRLGSTTVIAAGSVLHTPQEARIKLRHLSKPIFAGLKHVRFFTINTML